MRFSARTLLQGCIFSFSLVFFALLTLLIPSTAKAQTFQPASYAMPNADASVPQDQHTFVQSTVFELLDTAHCALTGESAINPEQGCLSVDPYTHKLTYAQNAAARHDKQAMGGLIGFASNMVGALYTPTTSTAYYVDKVAGNFGIVQPAYAQATTAPTCDATQKSLWGYGFCGLQPLLQAWEVMRNIAYLLLILVFVLIGLGIMLRFKADPRAVMTIQNQIPRVIVAIILITFSYAIAAIMIDGMWFTTYVGINTLTSFCPNPGDTASICNPGTGKDTQLSFNATKTLLETPITYVNQVFHSDEPSFLFKNGAPGIAHITDAVSVEIQAIVHEIVLDLINGGDNLDCGVGFGTGSIGDCIKEGVVWVFSWLARIIVELIILIVVLQTLFRVWWHLLKSYIFILISVITAPLWIVIGLLPNSKLNFREWLKTIFANLAVYPATVLLFVVARIFEEIFKNQPNPQDRFIPPLVGNPNAAAFGALIAFGVLLMAPALLDQIHGWLGTKKSGIGEAIFGGIQSGARGPGALGKSVWKRSTRGASRYESAGWLRNWAAGVDAQGADRAGAFARARRWTLGRVIPLAGEARGH